MVGDAVRDKDAVAATLLVCEIAAQAKANGSTVYKKLIKLYVDNGFTKNTWFRLLKRNGGLQQISQMMVDCRTR
jgi:phosphomannomutase